MSGFNCTECKLLLISEPAGFFAKESKETNKAGHGLSRAEDYVFTLEEWDTWLKNNNI